jgi:single-strand DNA-binding protein
MNIIGRLTRDAEVRTTSQDKQVVNFSVATNESYKNKQGERIEQTTYFDCAYWLSANVARLLTKGTLVELTGRVSTRAWTGKDGEPKAGLNFHTSKSNCTEVAKEPKPYRLLHNLKTTDLQHREQRTTSHFNKNIQSFFNIKILSKWHIISISTSKQESTFFQYSKKRGTVWGKS